MEYYKFNSDVSYEIKELIIDCAALVKRTRFGIPLIMPIRYIKDSVAPDDVPSNVGFAYAPIHYGSGNTKKILYTFKDWCDNSIMTSFLYSYVTKITEEEFYKTI